MRCSDAKDQFQKKICEALLQASGEISDVDDGQTKSLMAARNDDGNHHGNDDGIAE